MSKTKSATRKGAPQSNKSVEQAKSMFNTSQKQLAEYRKDPNNIGFLIAVRGDSRVVINATQLDQDFSIDEAIQLRNALSSCIESAKKNFINRLLAKVK
jgi:hypothetical protein